MEATNTLVEPNKIIALVKTDKILPSVSIILPVETGGASRKQTQIELKSMVNKAAKELLHEFPAGNVEHIIHKLHELTSLIDWEKPPLAIALFVSPGIQKYYPLPVKATKKLTIDTSFEVRDLMYAVKSPQQFIGLALSHHKLRLFYGKANHLAEIHEEVKPVSSIEGRLSAIFNDLINTKLSGEYSFKKWLRLVHESIKKFAIENSLPVFLMAPEELLSEFLHFPDTEKYIAATIHGNYEKLSKEEILSELTEGFNQWNRKHDEELINHLHEADRKNMLAIGITDVWSDAANSRGHLLVVEQNYKVQAVKGPDGLSITMPENKTPVTLIMKDAVDDVIEMVWNYGGDVSFAGDGKLIEFERIALIKRF